MHTPDMSDEELDALFQRSAGAYPDEYNLSAWLAMERKLDAAAMQQQVRSKVFRIFALETAVLLLALLGWWGYSRVMPLIPGARRQLPKLPVAVNGHGKAAGGYRVGLPALPNAARHAARREVALVLAAPDRRAAGQPSSTQLLPTTAPPTSARTGARRPLQALPTLAALLQPTRRSSLASRAEHPETGDRGIQGQRSLAVRPPVEVAALTPAGSVPSGSGGLQATEVSAGSVQSVSVPEAGQRASAAGAEPAIDTRQPGSAADHPQARDATTNPVGFGQPPVFTSPADSAADRAVAAQAAPAAPDSVPAKPRAAPVAPLARLNLVVLYAPELSTVRWARYAAPGSNAGLLLEYRFAAKWRLSAGALRSVKRYAARGSDYHPPAGYWTNSYTIDEVYATCRITDIPLTVRYDVVQRPQSTFFASAGLSSLLMRQEDYRYAYLYKDKPVTRDWSLRRGSNHFLSVLNLSAGYERTWGRRWAVQGEPFVKVPLGGVGFGKVKLSSAGVFFSLKYALLPAGGQ